MKTEIFNDSSVEDSIYLQLDEMHKHRVNPAVILVSREYFKSTITRNIEMLWLNLALKVIPVYTTGVLEVIPTPGTADAWEWFKNRKEYFRREDELNGIQPEEQGEITASEKTVKFIVLPLGTRFHYPGSEMVYVKISEQQVANWDDQNIDSKWLAQGIFAASPFDDVVLVK